MKQSILSTAAFTVLMLIVNLSFAQLSSKKANYTFDPLPYAYDALEPSIDARTMEIHYDRHHRAYFNNFVKAVEGTRMDGMSFEDIFSNISEYPVALRNNGGGHFNHTLFWSIMSPEGGGAPSGKLATGINNTFGSFDEFKKVFERAGATRFGSGWAWLNVDDRGNLFISSTPNQDNPLMDVVEERGTPILGLDVWEHAYYLKYQNMRGSYMSAFWDVVNWDEVARRYEKSMR